MSSSRWCILIFLFFVAPTAEAGANHGGGGDAVRLDIMAIRQYLYQRDEIPYVTPDYKIGFFPSKEVRRVIQELGTEDRIGISDDVTLPDGKSYPVLIDTVKRRLTFSRNYWLGMRDDFALKFSVVMHAYLGMIGLETTDTFPITENEPLLFLALYKSTSDDYRQRSRAGVRTYPDLLSPSVCLSLSKSSQTECLAVLKSLDREQDVVRLDVIAIRNYLYLASEGWSFLKNAGIDYRVLRKIMDAVGFSGLKLEDHVSLSDGVPRSAINRRGVPDIRFSRVFWRALDEDAIKKVALQLHEFLGLMGVEKTDQYHISGLASEELRLRFERGDAPTLYLPPRPTFTPGDGSTHCPNLAGTWRIPGQISGYAIYQWGCEKVEVSEVRIEGRQISWMPYLGRSPAIKIGPAYEFTHAIRERMIGPVINVTSIVSGKFEGSSYVFYQMEPSESTGKSCEKTLTFTLVDENTLSKNALHSCDKAGTSETLTKLK